MQFDNVKTNGEFDFLKGPYFERNPSLGNVVLRCSHVNYSAITWS